MSHILTQCKEKNTRVIWHLVKNLWPHRNTPWPEISLGMILGCGGIHLRPNRPRRNDQQRGKATLQGPTRLLQILLSESAYLIWTLRCERVIQEKPLSEGEIRRRWYCTINERLTIDKVTATQIKRNNKYMKLITGTWEPILRKEGEIPVNWLQCGEVLVGRTA